MTRDDTIASLAVNSWINGGRVIWPGANLTEYVELANAAHAYRAGTAASEARIKELEAELKDTEQDLHDYSVELGRLTSALNKGHRESVLIGQQMSAERIKELEARIKALEEALRDALPQLEGCFWQHTWHSEQPSEPEYLVNIRALLKEAEND